MHQNFQRFLHFRWLKQDFEFTCLPFGLASASRVFTSHEDSDFLFAREEYQMCNLSRWLTANEWEPRSLEGADPGGLGHSRSTGVHGKLPQIAANACTGGRVPGIPHLLDAQGVAAAQNKGKSDKIRGRPGAKPGRNLSQAISSTDWQAISSHSSSLPSTTSLQKPTSSETQGTGQLGLRRTTYQVVIRGRGVSQPSLYCVIETDASNIGWGAFLQREATGGCWGLEKQRLHINELELLALSYALKSFEEGGKYRSDNRIGQYSHGVIPYMQFIWRWF